MSKTVVPIPVQATSPWRGTSDCRRCGMRDIALFSELKDEDFEKIHIPIDDFGWTPSAPIFSQGDAARGVFTIRQGTVKLVRMSSDGRQRIVRLLRPGDVMGLEVLGGSAYATDAFALTHVKACRIPVEVIHQLSVESPRLHMRLMQKWQQALKDADDWLAALNFGTAQQRVINLILKLSEDTTDQSVLLYSRDDMGAMLDLKMETVSREISALVREKLIEAVDNSGRQYLLKNVQTLRERA